MNDVLESWRGCTRCDLCSIRENVVLGTGNPQADVMVIADKPGYFEDREGIPMVGPAGDFYHETLRAAGFAPEDIWVTNCVACVTPDNTDPIIPQLEACRERLFTEIRMVDPSVIILMGKVTVEHLLGVKKGISKLQLKTYLLPVPFVYQETEYAVQKLCIVTYNPGWVRKHPSKARNQPWHFMFRAFARARQVINSLEAAYEL